MTSTPPIQPGTTPPLRLHPASAVARAAYGAPTQHAPVTTVAPVRGADSVARIGSAGPVPPTTDTPGANAPTSVPSTPTDHSARLAGARVATPIDFDAEAARHAAPGAAQADATPARSDVYAMYRHPADKIAVATDLSAARAAAPMTGSSIDVSG